MTDAVPGGFFDTPAPEQDHVPFPVLMNTWKHHAGALRNRIAEAGAGGEYALRLLPERLVVIGTELMDLYTGTMSPAAIGAQVLDALRRDGCLEADTFARWLAGQDGYAVISLPVDDSRWVLRLGEDDGRYVHVHPGRGSPHTRRVRANVLKTAVLALAAAAVRGCDPRDVRLINEMRERIGLSPIPGLKGSGGLGAVIDALGDS